MKWIVYLFGLLMILASVLLFIDPNIILDFILSNRESSWIYFFAIVVRIILGAALLKTAAVSRFPLAFRIIGYIALAAALVFIVIGHEQFQHVMATLVGYFEDIGGWIGIIALVFGVFLMYGLVKK